jgi:ribosomal protein S18 acetylase RimI-like enzyme
MTAVLRGVTEADAAPVALLLAELGYPATEAEVGERLRGVAESRTGCVLVAESRGEVVGLIAAELVPYFPNGSTLCRITALVVAAQQRGRGIGEMLVEGATAFAREHRCAGIEITSAEHRGEAHRFYQRLGFTRTSLRFFRAV